MSSRDKIVVIAGGDGGVVRGLAEGLCSGARASGLDVATSTQREPVAAAGVKWVPYVPGEHARLARMFEEGAHLVLLPTFDQRVIETQLSAIRLARARQVRSIHQISLAGADAGSPVRFLRWLGLIERAIGATGLPHAILKCAPFTQSVMSFFERDEYGLALVGPFRDTRFAWLDARDAGEVAGRIIVGDLAASTCTLTGPEALDFDAVARVISNVLDEPVRYFDMTMPEAQGLLAARGVSADRIRGVREYWDYLVPGIVNAACCPTSAAMLGRAPRTVAVSAAECAAALRATAGDCAAPWAHPLMTAAK